MSISKYFRTGLLILLFFMGFGSFMWSQSSENTISLKNNHLALEFDSVHGGLLTIQDLKSGTLLAQNNDLKPSMWKIKYNEGTDKKELQSSMAGHFSYSLPSENELILKWTDFSNFKGLEVRVFVSISEEESFSYWNMEWAYSGDRVIVGMDFPLIAGLEQDEETSLVAPEWMGSLIKDPASILSNRKPGRRKYSWGYPGHLSMQFLGLTHPDKSSFYAACHDPYTYLKNFELSLNDQNELDFLVSHFTDLKSKQTTYKTLYPVVIGSVPGDWVSMAYEYRKWAHKQSWSLNSRLANGQVPEWTTNTALWVWNRGRSEGVLKPAKRLKDRLGLPLSVLWHWWHGASYDDEFPDYLPPREGSESFVEAINEAKKDGIRPLVYMNELQWGSTTDSWESEGAEPYAVKDENGNLRSHVYNIFTGRPLTNMCITTPFWREKYGGIAREAINELGVGGIYMDQACISKMCYDATHGHELGGGNYWAMYSGILTEQIRTGIAPSKEAVLSGEGVCEAWLPYLDVFLALQVSRERYSGIGNWETIPLFQAVYHPYGITYGNYSSLLRPPYDDLWPKEHRPELALTLLPEKFNTQFRMEQARSFVWGMQPMISNYDDELADERKVEIQFLIELSQVRNKALKHLLYGTYLRPPSIEVTSEVINISKLSIYAGQRESLTEYEKEFPMIYWGAWKAEDQTVGLPFANISLEKQPIELKFNAADYGLGSHGKIYKITSSGKEILGIYSDGVVNIDLEMQPLQVFLLEVASE